MKWMPPGLNRLKYELWEASESNKTSVKWRAAKRKSVTVIDIFKGRTAAVEAARLHDLTVAVIEDWIAEAQRGVEDRTGVVIRRTWPFYAESTQGQYIEDNHHHFSGPLPTHLQTEI